MTQIDISKARYIKQDKTVSFTCARCNGQKTAKKYAEFIVDGKTLQICNGCYGYLKSIQSEANSIDADDIDTAETATDALQSLTSTEETKTARENVSLSNLTDKDITYVCRLITPKEIRTYFQKYPNRFSEIRSGFRASSLSDDDAIMLVCKKATRPFIASFLEKWINVWLLQIQEFRSDLEEKGASPEESLLLALPDSVFSENIDLFFKITCDDYSSEYIALVKAAMLLQDQPIAGKNENGATVAIEQHDTSELSAVKEKNSELLALVAQLQTEIKEEKISHSRTQESLVDTAAAKIAIQQDLDTEVAQNNALEKKLNMLQVELDHFNQLSQYADTVAEDTNRDEFEYASVCEVFFDYSGQIWLSRLADIKDGKITRFIKNEDKPHYFENRDRLFWNDGPKNEGFIGVWQWNAVPNKSDPSADYVTTAYSNVKIIEIIELAECRTYADIAQALEGKIFSATPGRKCFFACPDNDGQMIGLLCNERDSDVDNGDAKLKASVNTLPQFEISSTDILTIGGKKIYQYSSLGMPQGVFKVRDPFAVVKEVIVSRATSAALRLQGLSRKEVQHCQSFLKDLPLQTIFQEIADAYACTESEAQEYVSAFIEKAESYLAETDLDIGTLAVALGRNKELVIKCKDLITTVWESENAEKLRNAQQQLDDIERAVSAQRTEVDVLEASYCVLQDKNAEVQAEIDEKMALAIDVERKVVERIAAARKNASDFICEMAFSTPAYATEAYPVTEKSPLGAVLYKRNVDVALGNEITDVDSFVDELAENLSAIGYDDIIAANMAQMISFCIGNRMPIVCGTNALKIADCIAAMFGEAGAYTTTLSVSQPDCSDICAAIQKEAADNKCVVVVHGVFDGLSLNSFNEITLQSENWKSNVVLIFPLNGVEVNMIPSYVWGQSMFIDGDTGLDHMSTDSITMHTTTAKLDVICMAEQTTSKRKQLKSLSGIISNAAMLNYAKYLAETNSVLKDDTQILTQITLYALSAGKKEQLLKELSSIGIDLEANKEISRYL